MTDLERKRAEHEAYIASLETEIQALRSQSEKYGTTAKESQEALEFNNKAVANAIKSRSDINISQEEDSQDVVDRKKKNANKIGSFTKADML